MESSGRGLKNKKSEIIWDIRKSTVKMTLIIIPIALAIANSLPLRCIYFKYCSLKAIIDRMLMFDWKYYEIYINGYQLRCPSTDFEFGLNK